jgi:hypothetical protein
MATPPIVFAAPEIKFPSPITGVSAASVNGLRTPAAARVIIETPPAFVPKMLAILSSP